MNIPSSFRSIWLRGDKNAKESVRYINFKSVKAWFENFKKKCILHKIKHLGESASALHITSAIFPEQIKEIPKLPICVMCVGQGEKVLISALVSME